MSRRQFHPALNIFLVFVFVIFGSLIGFFIGMFASAPFFDGSVTDLEKLLTTGSTDEAAWLPMMIVQGCTAVFGFIILPTLLMQVQGRSPLAFMRTTFSPKLVGLTVLIVLSFLVVDSAIALWNKNLDFPSWMGGFERWARELEESQAKTVAFLTEFKDIGAFVVGLIVIAVIPAIGEEILFHGIIQNEFLRGTKNIHIAVWISAVLFSSFHLQFFGFFPRLLIGALLGYLYFWSGSLWIPIIAHFINNALIVVALYLYQTGKFETINPNEEVAAPWPAILLSAAVLFFLLRSFKKIANETSPLPDVPSDTSSSID